MSSLDASPKTANPAERHLFHALDGLRGIAAFLVVAWHGEQFMGHHARPMSAYLAVDFFFILSGFVIAHAYDRRIEGGLGWRDFGVLRLIRFYPLFAMGLALGLLRIVMAVAIGLVPFDPMGLVGSFVQFLFLPVPGSGPMFPLNVPAWSLFAELIINVLYAMFWRKLSVRVLAVLVAVGGVGVAATALWYGSLNCGWAMTQIGALAARVTFGFFAGVLIFRLYKQGLRAPKLPAAALFLALAALMAWPAGEPYRAFYDMITVLVACPLVVWLGASCVVSGLALRFSEFFGQISYAIYIVHMPLLRFADAIDAKLLDRALVKHAPYSGVALIVLFLAVAWVADMYYDRPIRRVLSRRLIKSRDPARAGAPA